jgi:S-layer homology domain
MAFALLVAMLGLLELNQSGANAGGNAVAQPAEAQRWYDYAPDFQSVAFSGDGRGWAVGTGGSIYRYDGTTWSNYPSPTTEQLGSVTTTSNSEAWAVGGSGVILHLSNAQWLTATSPVTGYLTTVRFASPTDGWAMGYNGAAAHWDGSNWTVAHLTNLNIYAIDFLSPIEGWAVGDTALHYNGSTWAVNHDTESSRLFGVSVVSPTDAWGAALNGNMWHWDGTLWGEVAVGAPAEFDAVRMVSANDGWAVGGHHFSVTDSSFIYHYDGASWTAVTDPAVRALLGLACSDASHCTAVGDHGTILQSSGQTWSAYRYLPDIATMNGVSAADAQHALAVGYYTGQDGFYYASAYQWDGSNWQRSLNRGPAFRLFSVKMLSVAQAWAGGSDGVFMHWATGAWMPLTTTLDWDVSGLDILGSSGWAVGKNGSIWQYSGGSWTGTTYSPTGQISLNGVSIVSASDVWAVGNSGVAAHWNGSGWALVNTPGGQNLHAVRMLASNDGWAVGDSGIILHYDGSAWNPYTSPTTSPLYSLDFTGASEGWAGGNGFFLHYLNGVWSEQLAPSIGQLNSIDMVTNTAGFAVGASNFGEFLIYGATQCPQSGNCPTPTTTPAPTNTPGGPTSTPQPSATPTDCPNPFVDINGNIFYGAIHYLYCRGVVNGTDASHFNPSGTSTRAQFAKVVVLGFAIQLYTPAGAQDFTDVPPSYFAYAFIETGFHNGILNGFDANTCTAYGATFPCYLPNIPITRGQLTKLVVNAAHYPLATPGTQTFTDVPPSNVFYIAIETAHAKRVINGYPDHTFHPNQPISRDQMCQIVYKGVTTP